VSGHWAGVQWVCGGRGTVGEWSEVQWACWQGFSGCAGGCVAVVQWVCGSGVVGV
jgi:hypothetical protein